MYSWRECIHWDKMFAKLDTWLDCQHHTLEVRLMFFAYSSLFSLSWSISPLIRKASAPKPILYIFSTQLFKLEYNKMVLVLLQVLAALGFAHPLLSWLSWSGYSGWFSWIICITHLTDDKLTLLTLFIKTAVELSCCTSHVFLYKVLSLAVLNVKEWKAHMCSTVVN